jgi:dihydropteroate synthase
MIRVHDVREMARFARMADAIKAGLAFSPVSSQSHG